MSADQHPPGVVAEMDIPQLKKKTPIRCWLGIHEFPTAIINGQTFPLFWIVRCMHGCGEPRVMPNWLN